MAQAILTRYRGPTDTRGSRIVARYALTGERLTVSYDHALNSPENHAYAAAMLRAKHGGPAGLWVAGELGDGSYAHVYVPGPKP